MAKKKTTTINGIKFRPGEVDWEDAFSCHRQPLPTFTEEWVGKKITSTGLVGKMGKYYIVITEKDADLREFDYTLIPTGPRVEVRYQ